MVSGHTGRACAPPPPIPWGHPGAVSRVLQWGGLRALRDTSHPLMQPNQDAAWKLRALKGRQGLRPPWVSAASWGWLPRDSDDPAPVSPLQAVHPSPPGLCLMPRRRQRSSRLTFAPRPAALALRCAAHQARAPARVQAAPLARLAGLTSATRRRLLRPCGLGERAPGPLAPAD